MVDGRVRIGVGLIPDLPEFSIEKNLAEICRLARDAGDTGCDFFATEEVALTLNCPQGSAVKIDGPEVATIADIARSHEMYIAVGTVEREKSGVSHNSQILIDRKGRVVGVYRKIQLTNGEIQSGLVPGDEAKIFEADFGRVGFLICYDTQFVELARILGVKGANLIVFPHVGGAIGDDLIGRAIAYGNTAWTATVGRYYCAVCDPRGHTVASTRRAGELLVVDCDIGRMVQPINPGFGVVNWRGHQWLERRPRVYSQLLVPQVLIECPRWPLYLENTFSSGRACVSFTLVNSSAQRQRGSLRAEFPVPMPVVTDEYVEHFIDQDFGGEDWRPRPQVIRFDLPPHGRRDFCIRYCIPADAFGYRFVRISGRTESGQDVFWERRLYRFDKPPLLNVPKVHRASDVASLGAPVPLRHQCMGAPARSRTVARIAHDGRHLLVHAVCRKYGPWRGEAESLDSVQVVVSPREGLILRFQVARTGTRWDQRREGSHPVSSPVPAWSATVKRGESEWSVLMCIPIAEWLPSAGGSPWRFNMQRAAPLPDRLDRKRYMSEIVRAPADCPSHTGRRGVEWATWSCPYGRVDNPERLGFMVLEQ